jgi:hypothetical protein
VRILRAVQAVIERRGFCPTGEGGGVDNSCGAGEGGGSLDAVSVSSKGSFLQATTDGGVVGGHVKDGAIRISVAQLDRSKQGQGIGKKMYSQLIDEAHKQGLKVYSDTTVEVPAVRVYKSLEKDGYEVITNPHGVLPPSEDAPQGAWYGTGDKPVFEVRPKKKSRSLRSQSRGFCPTGEGGGVDNSCGTNEGGGGGAASPQVKAWAEKKFAEPEHAKAFAEWFGDSKTVDDKGEPIVMYHGTGASFDEFDLTKATESALHGPGVYMTDSADTASEYGKGGQVKPMYAAIRRPLDLDASATGETKASVIKALNSYKHEAPQGGKLKKWQANVNRSVDEAIATIDTSGSNEQMLKSIHGTVLGIGERETSAGKALVYTEFNTDLNAEVLSRAGIDGLKHRGGRIMGDGKDHAVFIAFRTTQVKSATGNRGTFDPKDPKITRSSRAWCPGASPPDNSCSPKNKGEGSGDKGGGGSSGGNKPPAGFSLWRESNAKTLDRIRSEVAASKKVADDLIADQEARRSAAYTAKEKARDENEAIKEQLKPAREKLRDALVASAKTQEEKDRWAKENLILLSGSLRPKEIAVSDSVRSSFDEVKSLEASRYKSLDAVLKGDVEMEEASKSIQSIRSDSAKEAWRQLGAQAKNFAIDDSGNGLGYKPDLYDSDLSKFAESVKATAVVDKSGARQEFDVVKKSIDEFVTAAISPVSWAGEAVKSATVVLDNKNERAYCSGRELNLHPSGNATTYAHELGHVLESQATLKKAAVDFHAARCRPEDEASIREKYPDSGYHPSERGNPDQFAKAIEAVYGKDEFVDSQLRAHYVGKVYRDDSGKVMATEIISMGLQMMHDNPAALASADPEYFDFMVGLMTGAERRFRYGGTK